MKKPQTIKSRAVRTLYKLNCFEVAPQFEIGKIGTLKSKYWGIIILDNGFSFDGDFISINEFIGASLLEKTVVEAQTIQLKFSRHTKDLVINSFSGKYKDVFEVYRFFMRVAEDSQIVRNAV